MRGNEERKVLNDKIPKVLGIALNAFKLKAALIEAISCQMDVFLRLKL